VHTASGMHNHGFREHKSLAIYAFLVIKVSLCATGRA
jgi:hypothetical protein